ncbi:hypothetical protein TRFO_05175 [Tritrichomonas foetus]|uniref:Uncharacterized protein n=1 Tax=Tritrichomonas foetus TaxID=1144522 RepID=A0A1J4K818_9EUKA|nr:hypothetical protein TRFO_05175 [Tritrichomonas foetus]|eukprot:OHT07543.1 hypothetical protein TRFO_05175 [Tritrichomonas foetus]
MFRLQTRQPRYFFEARPVEVDDIEDEAFTFESTARYNPRQKAPVLSPATPQFDKYLRNNLLRFKLPTIRRSCKTPDPRKIRDRSNKGEKFEKYEMSHSKSKDDFTTPKKSRKQSDKHSDKYNDKYSDKYGDKHSGKNSSKHSDKQKEKSNEKPDKEYIVSSSFSSQRRSNSASNYASTPNLKSKRYKSIISDGLNIQEVVNEVRNEFKKMKSTNFTGDVVFILKGVKKQSLLDIVKRTMTRVIYENNYTPNHLMSSNSSICCEPMNETESSSPESNAEKQAHSSPFSDAVKTTVCVSSVSDESTMATVKRRLACPFNGVVIFKPINGKYNTTLMKEYPNKIISVCSEYGYNARIIDFKAQIIECDMRTKNPNAPNSMVSTSRISRNENDMKQSNTSASGKSISFSKNITNKLASPSIDSQYQSNVLNVEVPWNSEREAEAIVRKHLTSRFKGTISFAPSIGLYSVVNMGNFPDRIVEICNEFHFPAIKKKDQVVDCIKTDINSSHSMTSKQDSSFASNTSIDKIDSPNSKIVQLPYKDIKSAEKIIRNQLESGRVGQVQFSCSNNIIMSMLIEICNEYGFSAQMLGDSTVTVKMCQRAHNELNIQIPTDTSSNMKKKLQRYFESGFIGKLTVTPSKPYGNITNFSQIVVDVCTAYGFQSKVIDNTTVRCLINPLFYDLSCYNDEQLEPKVKSLLISNMNSNFVVFSVKRQEMNDMKNAAERISKFCKSIGYPARISEFYYQRVFVNAMQKKGQINKSFSSSTSSIPIIKGSMSTSASISEPKIINVKLPTNDSKTVELMVRKQLLSSFSGTILFSPKSSQSNAIANFPQRIIDICREYGHYASVLNPRLQIVECRINKRY